TNVFNTWGIGDAARDDGILLLVAPGDRAVRIELGSGYSARYDSVAQLIIDEYLLPRFRQGQINEGIAVGVTQIIQRFDPNQPEPDTRQPNPLANVSPDGGAGLLTGGAVGGLGISLVGGMVGYRRWLRYRQRNCPKCAIAMERLDEHTDDDYLSPGQRQEESLKSVDYDVWLCRSCGYHTIHDFANFISRHQKCPDCRHKTMTVDSRTVLEPTYTRTGTAEITEDCTFCQHHRVYTRTIPRKERTSSSSGSSSGGSGGGGRSSGGGASGSW
ncbi:MAG TPA: TPM domain-containing protein, partial [Candidatus Obscuribacterales bacterium]